MDLLAHGEFKFPNAGLLASSKGRGWSGIAAELRCHPPGELPAIVPTQMEITLATQSCPGAYVTRKGEGVRQRTAVEAGTVWLCPVGVGEDEIDISAPLREVLHIYLPADRFSHIASLYGDARIRADAVRYLAGIDDSLIRQLGLAIHGELLRESAAGRMMVETASLALVARVAQTYGHDRPSGASEDRAQSACPVRIKRTIQYIHDNLENELTVAELAEIACLSPFHFARMFKAVTGSAPAHYVSTARLEQAKMLLSHGSLSLADIAHRSGFSSQAAFSTAFKRAMGRTPSSFRQMASCA